MLFNYHVRHPSWTPGVGDMEPLGPGALHRVGASNATTALGSSAGPGGPGVTSWTICASSGTLFS